MDIEKMTIGELMRLRDQCEGKINKRATYHEEAIRAAILNAYREGFTVYFSRPFDDSESSFYITNCDYHVEVEQLTTLLLF